MFLPMNTNTGDFPRECEAEGLSCQTCTSQTASQLAAICKGLRGKAIGQLFVQLYPHSACAPMHRQFAESYRQASFRVPKITATRAETRVQGPQRTNAACA